LLNFWARWNLGEPVSEASRGYGREARKEKVERVNGKGDGIREAQIR
jgi:hypothetical protein